MISTCSFDFLSEHKCVKGYEIGFVNFGKIFWLQPVDTLEKALNVGFEVLDFLEKKIPLKTGKQYFVVILEKKSLNGFIKEVTCGKWCKIFILLFNEVCEQDKSVQK